MTEKVVVQKLVISFPPPPMTEMPEEKRHRESFQVELQRVIQQLDLRLQALEKS